MSIPTEPQSTPDEISFTEPMSPADERILSYLIEHPPDYVPIVASRLGMHLAYVERRIEALVELGLVQPVSEEVIYTITDRGELYLVDEPPTAPMDCE